MLDESYRLYRVVAPHFCAGFVVDTTGRITMAAPILKWSYGWSIQQLLRYCEERRWFVKRVCD